MDRYITTNGACGQHLITTVFIGKGETILDFSTAKVTDHPTYLTIQISTNEHALVESPLACMNHSCNPNVFIDVQSRCCYTLRDIDAHEELTFFYPSTEWQMARPFTCLCGSDKCIGTISGAINLSKEILEQYRINNHILAMMRTVLKSG